MQLNLGSGRSNIIISPFGVNSIDPGRQTKSIGRQPVRCVDGITKGVGLTFRTHSDEGFINHVSLPQLDQNPEPWD